MDDIISQLKRDKSSIRQTDYARIIDALKELGYGGRPERWHTSKRPISEVLPEKVSWFLDYGVEVDPQGIRTALAAGGVELN